MCCFGCTDQKNSKNESAVLRPDTVSKADKQDSLPVTLSQSKDTVISVLILPAYDLIANGGASPDTRRILEKLFSNHDRLKVMPFPWRELMEVPYQMVYDKKYCKPITDRVHTDVIIMSQIVTKNEHVPGIWPWHYEVKIYNVKTDRQLTSIKGNDLKAEDFDDDINGKKSKLIADIFATF
jgi:hypothetical protein